MQTAKKIPERDTHPGNIAQTPEQRRNRLLKILELLNQTTNDDIDKTVVQPFYNYIKEQAQKLNYKR